MVVTGAPDLMRSFAKLQFRWVQTAENARQLLSSTRTSRMIRLPNLTIFSAVGFEILNLSGRCFVYRGFGDVGRNARSESLDRGTTQGMRRHRFLTANALELAADVPLALLELRLPCRLRTAVAKHERPRVSIAGLRAAGQL